MTNGMDPTLRIPLCDPLILLADMGGVPS